MKVREEIFLLLLAGTMGLCSCTGTQTADSSRAEGSAAAAAESESSQSESSSQRETASTTVKTTQTQDDSLPYEQDPIKDGIKHFFGYESDKDKYLATTTTTTTTVTTTNREEYERQLQSMYTLTIDDNYVVTRTDGAQRVSWVITYEGATMLERNAENEFTFKYDWCGAGDYTMYLEAFIDGEYIQVSNEVKYTIGSTAASDTESDVLELKDSLKHTLKTYHNIEDGETCTYEYYKGYIGDFDHDGELDSVGFFLQTDGTQPLGQQLVLLNADATSPGQLTNSYDKQIYSFRIWGDKSGGKEYIVFLTEIDGMVIAADAMTEEILWQKSSDGITLFGESVSQEEFDSYGFYESSYAPTLSDKKDQDYVYVFREGAASQEGMY